MNEPWRGSFHSAVGNKNPKAMQQAVSEGLPVNDYLFSISFADQCTCLHYAIYEQGGDKVVGALIEAGADVNLPARHQGATSESALGLAAQNGDLAMVERLLAADARLDYASSYDTTALSSATRSKKPAYEAVMKRLLAAGAKSNYQALVGAARSGSPAMIAMLAASGADVNEVSRWGTALILAVAEKREDTAAALLAAGADPALRVPDDHRNYPGKTAFDVAKQYKAKKLIPLLEAALATGSPAMPQASAAPQEKPTAKPAKKPEADKPEGVAEICQRIGIALKAHAPEIKKALKKRAAEATLAAFEKTIGESLPDDLRQLYLVHDGQKADADGLFPEEFANLDAPFALLSIKEATAAWTEWKELLDGGEFKKQKSQPDAGIRADWWNPKWIPFATDGGGDLLCVDLAPAKGGKKGQVILHQHASNDRNLLAPSVLSLLHMLAEHWESVEA